MLLAIGDIHGCNQTLQRLLARTGWHPERDRLWLTGDLVNRGEASLDVLRWVYQHRDRITVVLGNHDLHLLARAAGVARRSRHDRLREVLAAPDAEKLCSWLRRQPLLHREGNWLLVHAGLWPDWSAEEADRIAGEVSAGLDGPDSARLLAAYSRKVVVPWRANLEGTVRLSTAAIIFTLMRTVSVEGTPDVEFTGPIEAVPESSHPWFEVQPAAQTDRVVIFGHWARLGYYRNTKAICLDSGCVHGGLLTALRIDTGEVFQEPVAESDLARRQTVVS